MFRIYAISPVQYTCSFRLSCIKYIYDICSVKRYAVISISVLCRDSKSLSSCYDKYLIVQIRRYRIESVSFFNLLQQSRFNFRYRKQKGNLIIAK